MNSSFPLTLPPFILLSLPFPSLLFSPFTNGFVPNPNQSLILDPNLSSPRHRSNFAVCKRPQVLVAQGDIAGAKKAFKTSWDIMKRCSGESTVPTLAAKALADKTPTTSAELAKTYANVREQEMAERAR